MGTLGWKFDRPWKHGRSAWQRGKCKCEICHSAVVKYSRDYDRAKGAKEAYLISWTPEVLSLLGGIWTNQELSEKTGIKKDTISKKRSRLGIKQDKDRIGFIGPALPKPSRAKDPLNARGTRNQPSNRSDIVLVGDVVKVREPRQPRARKERAVRAPTPKPIRHPLPDPLERGHRVLRIRDQKEYRVAWVYPDLVHIIGVTSMFDPIVKVPMDRFFKLYEGKPAS